MLSDTVFVWLSFWWCTLVWGGGVPLGVHGGWEGAIRAMVDRKEGRLKVLSGVSQPSSPPHLTLHTCVPDTPYYLFWLVVKSDKKRPFCFKNSLCFCFLGSSLTGHSGPSDRKKGLFWASFCFKIALFGHFWAVVVVVGGGPDADWHVSVGAWQPFTPPHLTLHTPRITCLC